MYTISSDNVNGALVKALRLMKTDGVEMPSRVGNVLTLPEPMSTHYTNPTNRVLIHRARKANPIFHVMESLWMLAGRQDVGFVSKFVPRMAEFSNDGQVLSGAYGWRWRYHFHFDQLPLIIKHLRANPNSRRAVLQMYDGRMDILMVDFSKDIPCNTAAYFNVRENKLNMTVTCRSNDLVWGAYGANAVHFSILQEYLAKGIGCDVGWYEQVSNDFHIYERHWHLMDEITSVDTRGLELSTVPLVDDFKRFTEETYLFTEEFNERIYEEPFLETVAKPMYELWEAKKRNDPTDDLRGYLDAIVADDWRVACYDWLNIEGDEYV